jgi:acyl-coenzyme A synthetase/AMP-(fatty) acid ligase
MPDLPMTAAQKIKRNKLREAYLEEQKTKANEEGKRRT